MLFGCSFQFVKGGKDFSSYSLQGTCAGERPSGSPCITGTLYLNILESTLLLVSGFQPHFNLSTSKMSYSLVV